MSINKELKKLETSDYQNRKGEYPSSNVPDSIKFYDKEDGASLEIDFKNTSEQEAIDWFNSSKEANIVNKFKANYNMELSAYQDGDYPDDWVKLTVKLIKKSAPTSKTPIPTPVKIKVDDNETMQFSYTYVLSNPTQIKEINLLDYKDALEEIVKTYLQDKLINITIDKSSYTMTLNVKLEVGDKRRLGRLISQNTDLKKYVRKISYNNSQDKSGQLFVLKKANKEVKNETAN
jgi:hypothetical protein